MGKGKVNQFIKVFIADEPRKLFLDDLRAIHKVICKQRPPVPAYFQLQKHHEETSTEVMPI